MLCLPARLRLCRSQDSSLPDSVVKPSRSTKDEWTDEYWEPWLADLIPKVVVTTGNGNDSIRIYQELLGDAGETSDQWPYDWTGTALLDQVDYTRLLDRSILATRDNPALIGSIIVEAGSGNNNVTVDVTDKFRPSVQVTSMRDNDEISITKAGGDLTILAAGGVNNIDVSAAPVRTHHPQLSVTTGDGPDSVKVVNASGSISINVADAVSGENKVQIVTQVVETKVPAMLHSPTVRVLGGAGSDSVTIHTDAEQAAIDELYQSQRTGAIVVELGGSINDVHIVEDTTYFADINVTSQGDQADNIVIEQAGGSVDIDASGGDNQIFVEASPTLRFRTMVDIECGGQNDNITVINASCDVNIVAGQGDYLNLFTISMDHTLQFA